MNYSQEQKDQDGRHGEMNLFEQSYAIAENGKCEPFWNSVYKKAFLNMTNQMRGKTEKCNSQERGVDRIIYLENGKTITIDEKVRTRTYPDILLEYISNDQKNSPGWMEKDLSIDYLAYAFLDTKTAYLFDWRALKRAWTRYKKEWIAKYRRVEAQNLHYTTISVAVPIQEIRNKVSAAMIIEV